jgi:hypothetical protein
VALPPEAASDAPVLGKDCYAVMAAVYDENLVSAVHRHTTRHRKMTFAECSYMQPIAHDNNAMIISVYNEKITYAVNQGDKFLLAIVFVHPDGRTDPPHYLRQPFDREPGWAEVCSIFDVRDLLARASA